MSRVAVRSPLNPPALLAGLLAALVATAVLTQTRIPLMSSVRTGSLAFLVLGMAMCGLGGIGRVSDLGHWAHPFAIVSYLIGAGILVLAASVWFGFGLPYVQSEMQAFILVMILAATKVGLTLAHTGLTRHAT